MNELIIKQLLFAAQASGACARRQVGCVLVDKDMNILATGNNGRPPGLSPCYRGGDGLCPAANAPSGTQLDGCEAVHAEQRALLRCADVRAIHTVYVSCVPCFHCMKMLMDTGAKHIVALEDYPGADTAKRLWASVGNSLTLGDIL